jgi:hypothetical protein
VAAVAVAGLASVEAEEGSPVLGGEVPDEANVDGIVDVPAAVEDLGPYRRRLEQLAQVGD